MKGLGYLIAILALVALAAVATKPSDDECISRCTTHDAGEDLGSVVNFFDGGEIVYDVEDKFFYKVITNRISGQRAGVGVFSTVLFDQ